MLFSSVHRTIILIAIVSSILFSSTNALAAEQVVLKYRIFRESISVDELTTFAETGELSRSLRVNLALARQDPRLVRRYLTPTSKSQFCLFRPRTE